MRQQDSLCSLPPLRPCRRLFELADMLYKASHLNDKVCGPAVVHELISSFTGPIYITMIGEGVEEGMSILATPLAMVDR